MKQKARDAVINGERKNDKKRNWEKFDFMPN